MKTLRKQKYRQYRQKGGGDWRSWFTNWFGPSKSKQTNGTDPGSINTDTKLQAGPDNSSNAGPDDSSNAGPDDSSNAGPANMDGGRTRRYYKRTKRRSKRSRRRN